MSPFVTFEGIEGSGKSTHLRHLAAHLRELGRTVVETREPGDTPAGAAIRRLLLGEDGAPLTALTELFLYCADRTQHVTEVVRPALAPDRVVLCDRFSDSTIAYQGYGRGLDLAAVRALDTAARDGLWPSLTFLLDCPVEEGLARARRRAGAGDRFERETTAFHERVRAGFLALAAAEPTRFHVLDSAEPVDRVRARVIAAVDRLLGGRP
ncbi:MAG TPA: dTMP kinase [Candidatus Binatus sp.]|nr:dTMP kinase [Candidatus Binatus sp.]